MKTPVLTYNARRAPMLDTNLDTQLQIVKACAPLQENVHDNIKKILQSLCYKLFSVGNVAYKDGKQYTVADLCLPVHGMFQQQMIAFIHNAIAAIDSGSPNLLLRDAVSYELLQMLYKDPCGIYAALLYHYGNITFQQDVMQLATQCLLHPSGRPTLEWESMYLKFTDRSAEYG